MKLLNRATLASLISLTLILIAGTPTQAHEATGNQKPTLCWWTFDKGLHPTGAQFDDTLMAAAINRVNGLHDIPPASKLDYIESMKQRTDVTMVEWSGILAGEAPFGPSIGDPDPVRRAEILRQIKAWIKDVAKKRGIKKMLTFFGDKCGDDEVLQWRNIDASLKELNEYIVSIGGGVTLCYEPLNSIDFGDIQLAGMKGHKDQFCSDPIEFWQHVKKVGNPDNIALAFDFYHPAAQYRKEWIVEGDLEASRRNVTNKLIAMYELCREYVRHIHVAQIFFDDARMRGELHLEGGLIDYAKVMTYVWTSGYKGNYLLEYISTEAADKPLAERRVVILAGLQKAVAICKPKK